MGAVEISVIVIVSVAFVCAVAGIIYRKVKHKGGCCDCDCCSGNCSSCHSRADKGGQPRK